MRLLILIQFCCLCSSYFRATIFPNLAIGSAQMFLIISLCQTPLNSTCLFRTFFLLWRCIVILSLSSSLSCVHKRHFLGFDLCRGYCIVSKFVQVLMDYNSRDSVIQILLLCASSCPLDYHNIKFDSYCFLHRETV